MAAPERNFFDHNNNNNNTTTTPTSQPPNVNVNVNVNRQLRQLHRQRQRRVPREQTAGASASARQTASQPEPTRSSTVLAVRTVPGALRSQKQISPPSRKKAKKKGKKKEGRKSPERRFYFVFFHDWHLSLLSSLASSPALALLLSCHSVVPFMTFSCRA